MSPTKTRVIKEKEKVPVSARLSTFLVKNLDGEAKSCFRNRSKQLERIIKESLGKPTKVVPKEDSRLNGKTRVITTSLSREIVKKLEQSVDTEDRTRSDQISCILWTRYASSVN